MLIMICRELRGLVVLRFPRACLSPPHRCRLGRLAAAPVKAAILVSMLLAFVCSVVLEGPFAYLVSRRPSRSGTGAPVTRKRSARGAPGGSSRDVRATAALWYGLASNASLLRVPVRPELSSTLPRGWLYFDDASRKMCASQVDGGAVEAYPRPRATEHESRWTSGRWIRTHPGRVSLRGWNTGLIDKKHRRQRAAESRSIRPRSTGTRLAPPCCRAAWWCTN